MARRFTWKTINLGVGILLVVSGLMFGGLPATESACADDGPADTARIAPDAIAVLIDWGEHALATERFSEAEARFRQVLEYDWNHPRAYDLLQKTREARADALSRWTRQAQDAVDHRHWDRALDIYETILDEDPDNRAASDGVDEVKVLRRADDLVVAGLERFIMGEYTAAHDAFERALEIEPDDSVAALYAQRAEQETVQSSSLADLRSDNEAWTTYLDALKHFRAGDFSSAETLWRRILDKYPGNEAVLSNLEQVVRRQKGEISAQDLSP